MPWRARGSGQILGNGHNIPITAEQLKQVLGSDTVKQLAARSTFPLTSFPRAWRSTFPRRRARTVSCHLRPELRTAGSRGPTARFAGTCKKAFIALKNLQIFVFAMPDVLVKKAGVVLGFGGV
jgi:hypothetical protein